MRGEDRFTPPTDWCPHPQRWHSPDSESTEAEVSALVAAWVQALRPDLVVETGTHTGATARLIGRTLADAGTGTLHTIEADPALAATAEDNCRGLPVVVHRSRSLDWTPPGPIGFAWLDSAIDVRLDELDHLRPHLAPGAIVGIHDTGPKHPIRGTLDRLPDDFHWVDVRTPRGVLFGQVRP